MTGGAAAGARRRARVRVQGTVQGVGFRPYVYRLAGELGLGGYVLNDADGVLLEVEGDGGAVATFLERLPAQVPSLAVVEHLGTEERPATGETGFAIRASPAGTTARTPVSADIATCAACLRELRDPADRRYRYPFTNCTDCGPRFTIVREVPYDRPRTTMAGFQMCGRCRAEYDDPADRRFHAQPNACPDCGPSLRLLEPAEPQLHPHDPLAGAVAALEAGRIVAIKGIGGYHLACRADIEHAVVRLRAAKQRDERPFALMAADVDRARELVALGPEEEELLTSAARPIVLVERVWAAPVAASVARGSRELGVMLPYSPLHHLLLADLGKPIVLTSGNRSDEPIAFRDADALERLQTIADLLLTHDRPIETRTDDSVARVMSVCGPPRPVMLRRSRGYVPASLPLPAGTRKQLLAVGAEAKNTFCLAKGERAWVSHHIGDLDNPETLRSFSEGIEHFRRLFDVVPEVVAHDLHPDYGSTRYALALERVELIAVQHHHAHLAACLAEHGEDGPAIGAIFDGTGFGTDGTLWGGEILYGDLAGAQRVGALRAVRLPGGAAAIRQPWRMACAWLAQADEQHSEVPPALAARVDPQRWQQVRQLSLSGLASPLTTSAGRLFDAVAALCGLRSQITFEGQAAIELEAACDPHERGAYAIEVDTVDGRIVLDPREALRAVATDLRAGTAVGVIATRFHTGLAQATVAACARAAADRGVELVVLSGGVFQNRRLAEATGEGLRAAGLRVLFPQRLPPGDGGISFGQAAVAARRLADI